MAIESMIFFLVAVAVGLTFCGVVLLWRDNLLQAALTMLGGMAVVFAYYAYCRARRTSLIREQLPDVMELLARGVRAGASKPAQLSQTKPERPASAIVGTSG